MEDDQIIEISGNVFTDLGLKVCGNCEFHDQEGDDERRACCRVGEWEYPVVELVWEGMG